MQPIKFWAVCVQKLLKYCVVNTNRAILLMWICGDNVIIINADKVQLTGKKWTDRVYLNFTGYPGGQRELSPADLMKKGESRLFKRVLKGMLPKNKLGAQLLRNVYIYGGSEHPHAAQTPKTIDINTLK